MAKRWVRHVVPVMVEVDVRLCGVAPKRAEVKDAGHVVGQTGSVAGAEVWVLPPVLVDTGMETPKAPPKSIEKRLRRCSI